MNMILTEQHGMHKVNMIPLEQHEPSLNMTKLACNILTISSTNLLLSRGYLVTTSCINLTTNLGIHDTFVILS